MRRSPSPAWMLCAISWDSNTVKRINVFESPQVVGGRHLGLAVAGVIATVVCIFGAVVLLCLFLQWELQLLVQALMFAMLLVGGFSLSWLFWLKKKYCLRADLLGLSKPSLRILHVFWQGPVIFIAALTFQLFIVYAFVDRETSPPGKSLETLLSSRPSPLSIVCAVLSMVFLGPLWEELLLRGYLWGWLRTRFSAVLAVILSGVVFAFIHGLGLLIPYYFVLGAGLAWLRAFHRSIWAPLICHISLNGMVVFLTLLAFSR